MNFKLLLGLGIVAFVFIRKAAASNVAVVEGSTSENGVDNSSSPTAGKIITVESGESFSSIAQKEYSNMRLWPAIYDRNRDVVGGNPDMLLAGQQLVIPPLASLDRFKWRAYYARADTHAAEWKRWVAAGAQGTPPLSLSVTIPS